MFSIQHYMQDGAGYQARAILPIITRHCNIESSWDDKYKYYRAEVKVGRWENCREQGYVVMLRNDNGDQLNIAFYEKAGSDVIKISKWFQNTTNTPTFHDAMSHNAETKCWEHGKFFEVAEWIVEELHAHWEEGVVKWQAKVEQREKKRKKQ